MFRSRSTLFGLLLGRPQKHGFDQQIEQQPRRSREENQREARQDNEVRKSCLLCVFADKQSRQKVERNVMDPAAEHDCSGLEEIHDAVEAAESAVFR